MSIKILTLDTVAHTCNPSYAGGRDRRTGVPVVEKWLKWLSAFLASKHSTLSAKK
jgi:hypothetical protein